MSLIIAENVTHAFGAVEIVKNASFRLGESDRIGLVGPNGEGKTTLLRITGGMLEQTSGAVHRSSGLRIGYLPQDPPAMEASTVHEAMLDVFADLRQMENELHKLASQMDSTGANTSQELLDRYGQMQAKFEAIGGYDYHTRIEQVLTGLNFEREIWDRPLSQLSGGQRTRAYLAGLLLKNPDVLMLDEPTNHLDIDTIEWLEGWLDTFRGALVVVSHDRYFLDHVTKSTWEIAAGVLETYRAPYHKYLTLRSERHLERMRKWEAQQEYIAKTQEFIRIHLSGQRTKEAQGRRTRLERFLRNEAIDQPQTSRNIHLRFSTTRRTGDIVLRANELSIGYESDCPLVQVDQLEVQRGQRIAIVGANGSGKTTLLRTLLGELASLGGHVNLGSNVSIGALSQTHAELDDNSSALDAVQAGGACTAHHARSLLGSLLLSGDDAFKKISELSGGQRSRIILAQLMALKANLLMLDEPTNHLDIPSTEILQEALQSFDGSVIFVSHDRYLVQEVATHIWAIDGGQIRNVLGGWDDYLKWRQEQHEKNTSRETPNKQAKDQRKSDYKQARKQANLLQRLKRRHEELEKLIDKAESKLTRLNEEISQAGESGDMELIEKLGNEYQQQDAQLKTLWDEWEHVGEQLE